MEPLNLMVSLSHFANDKPENKPENKHGLSTPAGRRRTPKPPKPARGRLLSLLRPSYSPEAGR
jgi:hypothetical protein